MSEVGTILVRFNDGRRSRHRSEEVDEQSSLPAGWEQTVDRYEGGEPVYRPHYRRKADGAVVTRSGDKWIGTAPRTDTFAIGRTPTEAMRYLDRAIPASSWTFTGLDEIERRRAEADLKREKLRDLRRNMYAGPDEEGETGPPPDGSGVPNSFEDLARVMAGVHYAPSHPRPTKPLEPCPFCGSDNIDPEAYSEVVDRSPGSGNMPGCRDCGAMALSIGAWNRRASIEADSSPSTAITEALSEIASVVTTLAEGRRVGAGARSRLRAAIDQMRGGEGADQ